MRKNKTAFTLLEVLVALAITAIGLVPLLHLLITSISAMDSASYLSHATFIANEKLAEAEDKGYTRLGNESGVIENEDNNAVYKWQVDVTEPQQSEIKELKLNGLKKINVCVLWNEGLTKKQVTMSTLIYPEQESSNTKKPDRNSYIR